MHERISGNILVVSVVVETTNDMEKWHINPFKDSVSSTFVSEI